jgi:hypothetical protein
MAKLGSRPAIVMNELKSIIGESSGAGAVSVPR